MSIELIHAIRERIEQSHSKESIRDEVLAMGHSEGAFEEAYSAALKEVREGVIKTAELGVESTTSSPLPSVSSLLREGFAYAKLRPVLSVLLFAPLAFSYIATEVSVPYENTSIVFAASILSALALIVYFFNYTAVLHAVGKTKRGEGGLKQSYTFARQQFLSLMAIYILTLLALLGGFALFVIPGIIVYTTLFFAPYAFLHEGKHGLLALVRSRELVQGRWLLVTGKLLKFVAVLFFPLVLITVVYAFVLEWVSFSRWGVLAIDLVFEALMAFVAVINLYAMNELYHGLALSTTQGDGKKSGKTRYLLLIFVGIAAVVGLIAATLHFEQNGFYGVTEFEDAFVLKETVERSHSSASSYYAERGTYLDVCTLLREGILELYVVECNDSDSAWALSVSNGVDLWCSDTHHVAKEIRRPLGDRMSCLDLP